MIYLPENLFYNNTAPGIILVLDKAKRKNGKEKCFCLTPNEFIKGDPKNYIPKKRSRESPRLSACGGK